MTTAAAVEFRVLGPLEMRVAGEPVSLGGAKQRAVLAVLLLRAGEVVPVGRLVDEVWGDDPPPSAAHSLESYVSRLRQLFNGHGPALVRRGAGYVIELGGATVDARGFVELQERAALAAAMDAHAEEAELAGAALAMWRGPALADVALASAGRAEAERLEELRLRTYELRFDAELALGHHERAVGELQALVAQNPYRERFVAQLMLALYRAGRHAEALDVYEQTRRRLDEDLGLQPSADLQQLSGQIVRQDLQLRRPVATVGESPRPRRSSRIATLVAGGIATAAVMTLTASGGTPPESVAVDGSVTTKRVALVVPRDAARAGPDDPLVYWASRGFQSSATAWGYDAEMLVGDLVDDDRARAIAAGEFDLVVVAGDGAATRRLAAQVRGLEATRFLFVDARLSELDLAGVPNASGYPFADHESTQLIGYVTGMVAPRGRSPRARAKMVSIVVGQRTPHTERVVDGFRTGVRRALPNVRVQVDYATRGGTRTECEAITNRQIAAGSDAVFALGRPCSQAALAVARIYGVWGLGAGDDGVQRAPHILATTYKQWESVVARAVNDFELGTLAAGRDVELGLADDYVVGLDTSPTGVSEAVWAKVVQLCSTIRQHTVHDAP